MNFLKDIANSKSENHFSANLQRLKDLPYMNKEFITYFDKHLKVREKWIFCFIKNAKYTRTNLHIESWHRILKYDFLYGRPNKRCDILILALQKVSEAFSYKEKIKNTKGLVSVYKRKVTERHNILKTTKMNILEDGRIQVIYYF